MKLFSLRLTTLKSKLYAIVFASFVVRVVAFFFIPNSPSSLAPDEKTYVALTEWIAKSLPANEFPENKLYIMSRSLIFPASLLNRIGFSGIDAIRITASVYGLLTLLLVVNLLSKIEFKPLLSQKQKHSQEGKLIFLFVVFAFLPSHFFWSLLGLRESAVEFWVLSTFIFIFYLKISNSRLSIFNSIGLILSITMVYFSRPQVGMVLAAALIISLVVFNRDKLLLPLILVTIGSLLGHVGTNYYSPVNRQVYEAKLVGVNASNIPKLSELEASSYCKTSGGTIIYQKKIFTCSDPYTYNTKLSVKQLISEVSNKVMLIPTQKESNQKEAVSRFTNIQCPHILSGNSSGLPCIAWQSPHNTFSFLFRPLLGVDTTSTSSLLAATENIFWLLMFIFIFLSFMRNQRLAFFASIAPSIFFMALYSVLAGEYEGNMGTAFRHKSLILWVVLLLLASTIVATQQRKAEREGISASSQK